jgi:hypothetical protein
MIPRFDTHKSSWQIRVATHEIMRVNMMLDAISRDASPQAVVWLVKLSPKRRSWIIRDHSVMSWITADADYGDPVFALPIPDTFFRQLFDIAQDNDFDLAQLNDGVDLYCNEVDGTIVATNGGRYIAIDEPTGVTFGPRDVPYHDGTHSHATRPTVATVQVSDLHIFANLAHNIPRGVTNDDEVAPFISIAVGDGTFAFTADWRRYGLGRVTGAVPARTTGSITTQFYPYAVSRLLRLQDPKEKASLFVDGVDAEYLYFAGDDWGIRILQDDEITGRWYRRVVLHLSQNECNVVPHSTESLPRVMKFSSRGIQCVGQFFVRDGVHDIFQVSSSQESRVEPTLEVYEMLNSINEELIGSQVIIQDGRLTVVAQCCLNQDGSPSGCVQAVIRGIEKCASIDSFLPLFSPSR